MAGTYAVDIIMVNWNGGKLLYKAIYPLTVASNDGLALNIIVVDNASADNSLELISNLPVTIVKNKKNEGFGKACNMALPFCKGEYILLLNPDTESTRDTLLVLLEALVHNKSYGAIGPRQLNEQGKTMRTCGRFPTLTTAIWELSGLSKAMPGVFKPTPVMLDWDHSTTKTVDHVMGSYMLISREVINKVGFMDDDYFVYYEDVDLSKRISNAGYKVLYFVDTTIFHEGGGLSKSVIAMRLFYSLNSKITFWRKHFGKPAYILALTLALTLEPLARLLPSLFSLNITSAKETLRAYKYLYKGLFRS